MEAVVATLLAEYDVALVLRDVRDDPETRRRYAAEIPVLLAGATEIARHRVTPGELRDQLDALGLPRR